MSPHAAPRAHEPHYPPFPPPLPTPPGFDPTPRVRIAPPMVYVEETFEYRTLTRDLTTATPPTEAELSALGKEGWELVSVLHDGRTAHWYFKRVARG